MLRYAALNHELPKVIRDVYRSGSKVILDYARENCDPIDAQHVSDINMKMMTTVPGSMFASTVVERVYITQKFFAKFFGPSTFVRS